MFEKVLNGWFGVVVFDMLNGVCIVYYVCECFLLCGMYVVMVVVVMFVCGLFDVLLLLCCILYCCYEIVFGLLIMESYVDIGMMIV